MTEINEALIDKIIALGNGRRVKKIYEACKLLSEKIFLNDVNVDESVFEKLLPMLINWLEIKEHQIQIDACIFIAQSVKSSNEKTKKNTRFAIDAGAIPKLIKLLSSEEEEVLRESLACLHRIALYFSEEVVESQVLPPLFQCLKSENPKVAYNAASLLNNISCKSDPNIPRIIEAKGVELIVSHLEPKRRKICEQAFGVLLNIVCCNEESCQRVLESKALKTIKRFFDLKTSSIKSLALKFIHGVTYYGEKQINMVIEEGFIPLVFQLISIGSDDDDITIDAIKVVRSIIAGKQPFVKNLINDNNIITLLTNNLESHNTKLLEEVLCTLCELFELKKFEEIFCQKFKEYDGPAKLQHLLQHENLKIKKLSNLLREYVDLGVEYSQAKSDEEFELEKSESDDDVVIIEHLSDQRQVKRTVHAVSKTDEPSAKKSKVSDQQQNGEEHDNNRNDDLDMPLAPSGNRFPLIQPIIAAANDALQRNENGFDIVKYWSPPEFFLNRICKNFSLAFDRIDYNQFLSKIQFRQISCDSKPDKILSVTDKSGFECLSLFFTGKEGNAQLIREGINKKWLSLLIALDKEEIITVIFSRILIKEHFETFAVWTKCRFLIYCNGKWDRYGSFEKEDQPVFVMEKKEINGETSYQIVLSLKSD